MSALSDLIARLRQRHDLTVAELPFAWRVTLTREPDLLCEIIIAHEVLEWFAAVTNPADDRELWSDWMDYVGYDDRPRHVLEEEMARDILAFIQRLSTSPWTLPLSIYDSQDAPDSLAK